MPCSDKWTSLGNSLDKLCHPRSVAYSVEFVLLNKHQILGDRADLDCYPSSDTCMVYWTIQRETKLAVIKVWSMPVLVNFQTMYFSKSHSEC